MTPGTPDSSFPTHASLAVKSEPQLCYYSNQTAQVQVLKLSDQANWERVVFPFQQLFFWADADADLKIYSSTPKSAPLQLIPCKTLVTDGVHSAPPSQGIAQEVVQSQCPYCGVGCGLEAVPNSAAEGGYKIRGDRQHPSSQGMICVKGATIMESLDRDRLLYPLWRERLDQPFRRISWDEAVGRIVERIQAVQENQGADGICMYGSGQFQTEDYYTAQKLLKGCLGTNNFDANSRLCMSSAVAAYIQSFGSDGPPCCYDDLELTDCAFLIGTNTAECHPIVFNRLRKHHKQNRKVKLIVVDPRRTPTAEVADLHLAIAPGTDIDLLHGIGHLLLQMRLIDPEFIDECTTGFADYVKLLGNYPPEQVAQRCGITVQDLEKAARYWGQAKGVLSLWSMGINQSSEGTAKARSLINLHLLTGQVGRPGCGPFSLTGQPNAMGGREAGGLSHLLPGYRLVKNPQHRHELEELWQLPAGQISATPGRSAWEMITGLETGDVGLLWIAATNPVVSMPDLERTKAALLRSPFTVYQDAYFPTETAAYAHLLLPAAQWGEKTGVMTNSERCVTLCPAFRSPPGEAKADWEIFAEVGRRLGFEEHFSFETSAAVYGEFVQATKGRLCDQSGLSHERLETLGPLQWPCPEGLPDPEAQQAKRLYTDYQFSTSDRRAHFGIFTSQGLGEPVDIDYPYVLTNGRLYGHWHTQTRTGRIPKITKMHPRPLLEIHPQDADRLCLSEGDWVDVRSRRAQVCLPVHITKGIRPGTVFMPMHWGYLWGDDTEVNSLTHPISCPISLQPELKACAVQLVPIHAQGQRPPIHPPHTHVLSV
ncbi:molybdopterin-dependent oxidoreductase [Candidatus Synechococcus calcipolaris G9]|uniref:Molybdopterin-dependent oxidoreductase n=1 Tax=Candidatus Synechococcus calcipolaris G9 TaxID=1497997 RepID=A0ABT6EVQ6_9SYNE|nr:molybdopterin-dependent oxidoreductase [Candidatus Synechococcus calcipolaris]MDG2989599.1 molybdopterin-dependent oxidoreductase [Candidatus Synechococcus calcipolaris G9]